MVIFNIMHTVYRISCAYLILLILLEALELISSSRLHLWKNFNKVHSRRFLVTYEKHELKPPIKSREQNVEKGFSKLSRYLMVDHCVQVLAAHHQRLYGRKLIRIRLAAYSFRLFDENNVLQYS